MNILIADDDMISAEMVAAVLEEHGYRPHIASDGAGALEHLRTSDTRIAVLDWQMPGLTGPEVCSALRAGAVPRYVYTLLLTARTSQTDVVEGLRAGADDFIGKPFDVAELLLRVNTGRRILSLEGRDMAIMALARLAAARDQETGGHLERVRAYCRAIATELRNTPKYTRQMSEEFVNLIYLTSPLHDVGKLGIPDCVLLKPEKLTDREFQIMKRHTIIGAETLDAAVQQFPDAGFLRMARDIALNHHERWDGSGYPNGIAGEQIPIEARIMAVADVYDACVSKRVYKAGFSHDVARSIVTDGSGKHFDPDVVEAFVRCENEIVRIAGVQQALAGAA